MRILLKFVTLAICILIGLLAHPASLVDWIIMIVAGLAIATISCVIDNALIERQGRHNG